LRSAKYPLHFLSDRDYSCPLFRALQLHCARKSPVLRKPYSSILVAKIPINIYYFFNQKTSYSFILYVEEKRDPRFKGLKQGSDFGEGGSGGNFAIIS
jgi:hypothetical protein